MITTRSFLKSLSGDTLWGDQALRFVFVDEAGTSAPEPVTVVVGIIANADQHLADAESLVEEAIGGVPPKFRPGFVFHAMQIFGDKKYHADWSLTDRLHLLKSMMSIPRRLNMAITVAAFWRGANPIPENLLRLGMSPAQVDHFMAFTFCLAVADRNIRQHAGPREVATVVAEDVPEMRKFLRLVPTISREGMVLAPEEMRQTVSDREAGYSTQRGDLRVTRIRKSVHFVEKPDDALVQVADACAFGFRRFFAGEKFGVEFARAIVGHEAVLRNFASPGGCECYWPSVGGSAA